MNDSPSLEPLVSYIGTILGAREPDDDFIRERWSGISDLLLRLKIFQYVALKMQDRLAAVFSNEQLAALRKRIHANRARNTLLFRQAAGLAREFGTAGIPLVFMKGAAAIPMRLFRPEERWISDIDALIPPDAVTDARTILDKLGYQPGPEHVTPHFHHIEPMYHPRHIAAVELHVKPYAKSVNGESIARDMLRDAVRSNIGDTSIRVPSPTDHAWLLARKDVIPNAAVRFKDGLEMTLLAGSGATIDYPLLYRREEEDSLRHTVDSLLFVGSRFFGGNVAPSAAADAGTMERWLKWSARYYRHEMRHSPFMASRNRYGGTVFYSAPGFTGRMKYIHWLAGQEFLNRLPGRNGFFMTGIPKFWRYTKDYFTHAFHAAGNMLSRR